MKKYAVLVDSTAVIKKEVFDKYDNLFSVPLKVLIGNESYSDGIDLSQELFFDTLESQTDLPTTSQPAAGDVSDMFEKLLEEYEHVFYLTISSKISGTYQTGEILKNQIDNKNITVFDTAFTSIVQNTMAVVILDMIKGDESLKLITAKLEFMRENSTVLLVVDDLKHLQRTGRISFAAASIGSTLQIKPILHFKDGSIVIKKKIRTIKKAHNKLIEYAKEADLTEDTIIALAHANGLAYAEILKKTLLGIYPNNKIEIHELSPVVSVHTGAGTIGLGWINVR